MARLGLGRQWTCLFANDNSPKKARAYQLNFNGGGDMICKDVETLTPADLPGRAMLSWGSFPCQDLSLAGQRGGLRSKRSGTFWPFWDLMLKLKREGRGAPLIVLENVVGAITSHGGADFQSLLAVIAEGGYRFGPLVMDAVHFVPQSRPRLFIVAVDDNAAIPDTITRNDPDPLWAPPALQSAHAKAASEIHERWLWWRLPAPPQRSSRLIDCIEEQPGDIGWNSDDETRRLLDKMSEVNRAKVDEARRSGQRQVGAVYKRTRRSADGENVQRAEVRFDGISGCLRTPVGGSSRQTLLFVEKGRVRSRLLSARETARLMGAPERYRLPDNYNEAYHLMGDGLAVPVVSWLERHVLRPLAKANRALVETS